MAKTETFYGPLYKDAPFSVLRHFKMRHFPLKYLGLYQSVDVFKSFLSKLVMSDCRMQNKFIMVRIFLRLALQERILLSFLCQFGWQMHKI